jgi:hypothetical protein
MSVFIKEKLGQEIDKENNIDKNRHITVVENLISNINKLELLEKRLSFALERLTSALIEVKKDEFIL